MFCPGFLLSVFFLGVAGVTIDILKLSEILFLKENFKEFHVFLRKLAINFDSQLLLAEAELR